MQQSLESRREELEALAEVVATIEGRPVTRGELREAFNWVADKAHWKNPIDCSIVLSTRQVELVREAVVFFAGCRPTFTKRADGSVRVRAVGYFAAIGA